MGPKPLSNEAFLLKAKQKHKNRFIYTDTVYVNKRTTIKVTCRIHGTFSTKPSTHLDSNGGCSKCSTISGIRKKGCMIVNKNYSKRPNRSTFKVFIKKCAKYDNTYVNLANKIHNNKYRYKVITPIINIEKHLFTIECPKHGLFTQRIKNHLLGQGCPKCGIATTTSKNTLSFEQVLEKSNKIHNSSYIYFDDSYINTQTKMKIQCKKCTKIFHMTPDSHINQKQKCPYCRGFYKTIDDVSKALKNIHHKYEIVDVAKYTNVTSNTNIVFTCPEHGNVTRAAKDIFRNLGCRKCKTNGFSILKPGILYYVSVEGGSAYKIGITNSSIVSRFKRKELENIKVIKEWYFEDGYECYLQEQHILKEHAPYKYAGPALLSSGNTELFNCDILQLDNCC